jgi:hypothetical protein
LDITVQPARRPGVEVDVHVLAGGHGAGALQLDRLHEVLARPRSFSVSAYVWYEGTLNPTSSPKMTIDTINSMSENPRSCWGLRVMVGRLTEVRSRMRSRSSDPLRHRHAHARAEPPSAKDGVPVRASVRM